ncbi:MFS transporter (plasmid) [Rhodococcus sp. USK10]|uniref:MFS transporter n=1 Tax=Rhodococcus sp. USK10 TaxID=2789739 RepID=UPI001C5ECB4C|nr:MFS transporter [Rhodococcus sp. USK10]QYB00264.1 MFS transporter [Rhodococcus sp. USK10]
MLSLAIASYSLPQAMVIPMLSDIRIELGTDPATTSWVVTAFLLSSCVATPIGGRLGDAWGKRRILVLSQVALGVGALLAAVAPNIEVLLLARVIQGLGSGTLPLAFGIVRDEWPDDRVPSVVSMLSALVAVGGGAAIVVSGPVIDEFGYRSLFVGASAVALLVAICVRLALRESTDRDGGTIPVVAAVIFSGWTVALLLPVSQVGSWGWTSPRFVSTLTVAVALLVVWVLVERRSRVPLVDVTMMRLRGVWSANLVAFWVGFSLYAFLALVPQLVQTPSAHGYGFTASATEAGLIVLPSAVTSFLSGIAAGSMHRTFGFRVTTAVGCLTTAAGIVMAIVLHDDLVGLGLATAVFGAGSGLTFASLASATVRAVPSSQTGVAAGLNANLRTVGGAFGLAVSSTVVVSGSGAPGVAGEGGYVAGFGVLAMGAVVAALSCVFIPAHLRRRRADAVASRS